MARSWGHILGAILVAAVAIPASPRLEARAAEVDDDPDPSAECSSVTQGAMTHVFDIGEMPVAHYVNDHTLIQAPDGQWHLFGIFHREPIGDDTEFDFIHAVADEPDPARWKEGAFVPAPEPYRIALHADPAIGETHAWAPHVVSAYGRYWMLYQGGGTTDDRASIRLAESDDLYRWSRVGKVPLFEDFCAARDPMLVRRDASWALYYTRCDSTTKKASGVAQRLSTDLVHWTEPRMVLTLPNTPPMPNSGFTESPFVFQRGENYYLSVSSYPIAWDATMVYRSRVPWAFGETPFTRLRAHAAEWVFGRRGEVWMTHAGPGQRGVWLSRVDGL